jgi:hypothetical protein
MNIRFIFVAIALLCILALMWIILPMMERTTEQDPYSVKCPAGTYATDGGCMQLTSCANDSDCWYLEKDTLPPRVGKCVQGMCHAYCGSGRLFECVN